jgi:hypothetical protein
MGGRATARMSVGRMLNVPHPRMLLALKRLDGEGWMNVGNEGRKSFVERQQKQFGHQGK